MDTMRGFGEQEAGGQVAQDEGVDAPVSIGTDERRMHVRAYNYWASLLSGSAYPSIEDLDPAHLEDFGPHSVLLDFTAGVQNPVIAYLGAQLRTECGLDGRIESAADVPSRSLLSRLTDHYLQIIANRAPIGFEAEFVSQRGFNTLYRGILMPFSSDDESIDFIYGVINWKELADPALEAELVLEIDQAIRTGPRAATPAPVWADGPRAGSMVARGSAAAEETEAPGAGWDEEEEEAFESGDVAHETLSERAGLGEWLEAARKSADAVRLIDSRSRAALYRALGYSYDFARIAEARPQEYAALLEKSGLKAQARAPMTPIVKLVFGATYDKARVTEFAAVLAHAARQGLESGALWDFLEAYPGGLKGVVRAERAARTPAPRRDRGEAEKTAWRAMTPQAIVQMESGEDEFVLLMARRVSANGLAVLAPVTDAALIARALRHTAKP